MTPVAIKEYIKLGVERMSVIEKGDTMIMLMDQTRIMIPQTMKADGKRASETQRNQQDER